MNDEQTALETRAARHAALGDRHRLQIVDHLALGDLSPGELQERLGVPSNLLAHHLRVLEGAGIVARGRSESDRRRSYVRLIGESVSDAPKRPAAIARRVLFVCTANSARSQFAAELWRQRSAVPAASAGTRPADEIAPRAVTTAARHGIRLAGSPSPLDAAAIGTDLVISVCDAAYEQLGSPSIHWSVPDPVLAGTDAAFEAAFQDIARRVDEVAPLVRLAD